MKKCKITNVDKALEIINEVDKVEGALLLYPADMNLLIGYSKEEIEGENDPGLYLSPNTRVLYREAMTTREMFKELIKDFYIVQPFGEVRKSLKELVERM